MPRAALISWDNQRGLAILSAGPNTFLLPEATGDMQKDAEAYTRLSRYLQSLAPILPPEQPAHSSGPLPEVTEQELARATRFSYPQAARGIRQRPSTVSGEELLDLINAMPGVQDEDNPPD